MPQQHTEDLIPGNAQRGQHPQENVLPELNLGGTEQENSAEQTPEPEPPTDTSIPAEENAQNFEDRSEQVTNQNLRLISAIIVAIISAAFLWWFVS